MKSSIYCASFCLVLLSVCCSCAVLTRSRFASRFARNIGAGEHNCSESTGREACSSYPDVGVCNELTGNCSCNATLSDCFKLADNFCTLKNCTSYNEGNEECRQGKKSRTTALLLSIFLINFGAANFYIARYELAIPQLILGLVLCCFQFGSCGSTASKDDHTSYLCIACCSLNGLFSLLFFAWWLADLIIFAQNTRPDGDQCMLY